ncbi:Disease resistance protein RPM1 [Carex littledalei]|uniref:Disease resistance protein RPM1 n=1 Tax=Carex littledalei TaxID=544730 RepID=A0A833RAV1_9POAL|nr:Disease resistance protein RPM1 [Carex littledalei]
MVIPDPGIEKSICKHLVPIIIYWVGLLRGKHTCIEEIENTYDRMKASLKDTHGGEGNETLKTARRQGREITYRIENLLDKSEYYIEGHRWMGPLSCTLKYLYNITHTCNLCSIAQEINNIQKLVPPIQVVLDKYARTGASIVQTGRLENRHMAPVLNEFNFVGMKESEQALLELLVDEEDDLKVIAVTGKPGAGKTTLVNQVYENQQVKRHFNCRAWVQLEDSFTMKQMLLSLITQLYADSNRPLPEVISKMETIQLADVIMRYLKENRGRYVIVLDGASENILERSQLEILINIALPKDNNYGRVVITTRAEQMVKELLLLGHIIKVAVAALDKSESWDLFCKRASGSDTDPFPEDTDPFPEEVENKFSDRIYNLCDGLSLAISVLGGLLRRKFDRYDEIITQIDQRSQTSGVVTEVLRSSINEISDENLKSCLLYFCIFPRNFAVTANNLIRIWCAEGFAQTEQIANECLTKLVKRNVVQAAEVDYYEHKGKRIKSYKVHDLMHGFLQAEVEEVNFYMSTSMNHQTRDYRRACRLSVPDTRGTVPSNINLSRLRSLFIFRKDAVYPPTIFSSLRSLRVLSLENVPITNIPKKILKLTHLRYLNLRNTNITEIPRSIGNFRNLETLNLKGTYVKKLPKEIRKLKNLRHLLAYRYETLRYTQDPRRPDGVFGVEAPKGIRKLNQLVTLSVVAADDNGIFIKEVANLHQLRRLGIMDLKEKDGKNLGEALKQMDSISSMSLTLKDKEKLNLEDLQLNQDALRRLQRLYLRGELREGLQFSNLGNLVRLRLSGSQLPHESFEVLKNLPYLVDLSLIRAFNVEKLSCRGGFPRLKVLDIDQFDQLVEIEISESMPQLSKMIIRSCCCLRRMPLGIVNLKEMKELHLFEMPTEFVNKLRNSREDGEKVQHIPNKWFYNDGIQKEQVESAYTNAQQSGVHETASEGTSRNNELHDEEITEE